MREMLRAVVTMKPMIALVELDKDHGGMSFDEIRAKLLEADAPCEKSGTQHPNKYAMWGIASEVESWGYHLPTGGELFDALFATEVRGFGATNNPGPYMHIVAAIPATLVVVPPATTARCPSCVPLPELG